MEPALTIVVLVAAATSLALVADLARASASWLMGVDPSFPEPIRRAFAVVVLGAACLAVARPSVASAATAPPSARISGLTSHGPPIDAGTPSAGEASPAPHAYVVERGDCLWRIASRLLSAAGRSTRGIDVSRLWRAIYEANRDVIGDDPNLIHPGQVLVLPQV
jgi:nucleoid-associated protein YgaU